jgi:hypothetical protein
MHNPRTFQDEYNIMDEIEFKDEEVDEDELKEIVKNYVNSIDKRIGTINNKVNKLEKKLEVLNNPNFDEVELDILIEAKFNELIEKYLKDKLNND